MKISSAFVWCGVFALGGGMLGVAQAKSPVKISQKKAELTSVSLEVLLPAYSAKRVLMIDARPSFALSFGKIRGAVSWPASDRQSEAVWKKMRPLLEQATREKRLIVVYCTDTDCKNSRALGEVIAARGFACSVFEGGIHQWKEADLPTE